MDSFGVDLFRINLSHTNIGDFKPLVDKLRRWTDKQICPDTEGAQLRTKILGGKPQHLYQNEELDLLGTNKLLKKNISKKVTLKK